MLKQQLPTSSSEQRNLWAQQIVSRNIDISQLSSLLEEEYPVSSRFAWLLSGVGYCDKAYLFKYLPRLFDLRTTIQAFNFEENLIKYWRISGIPNTHKAIAIDILFKHLTSSTTSVSIKSCAVDVLVVVCEELPVIKSELQASLEQEIYRNTPTFKKKAQKVLKELQLHRKF